MLQEVVSWSLVNVRCGTMWSLDSAALEGRKKNFLFIPSRLKICQISYELKRKFYEFFSAESVKYNSSHDTLHKEKPEPSIERGTIVCWCNEGCGAWQGVSMDRLFNYISWPVWQGHTASWFLLLCLMSTTIWQIFNREETTYLKVFDTTLFVSTE